MIVNPPRELPFILASTHMGTMILNSKDYCIAPDGTKFGVGHSILQTGYFEYDEISNLQKLLQLCRQYFGDGVHFLDCGANIGVHTITCASIMTGWGEVISFEAQERIFYALAGNIALNNCFNAKAIYGALGCPQTENEQLDIPTVNYCQPASFGSLELRHNNHNEYIGQCVDYAHPQKVPLRSIDSFHFPRIDIIKIDVEGMEMEVLKGALNSIHQYKPVLQIEIIKTHSNLIQEFLTPFGYQFFIMGMNIMAVHQDSPLIQHFQTS